MSCSNCWALPLSAAFLYFTDRTSINYGTVAVGRGGRKDLMNDSRF